MAFDPDKYTLKNDYGNFYKWQTPGAVLEGKWIGVRDGKYGLIGMMKLHTGESINFPLHTALVNEVGNLAEGTSIAIEYQGEQVNPKSGRTFKAFKVYTLKPDAEPPAPSPNEPSLPEGAGPLEDDDLPF